MSITTSSPRLAHSFAVTVAITMGVAACGSASTAEEAMTGDTTASATAIEGEATLSADLFDSSVVHDIDVDFDTDDLDEIIASYLATGDKDWMDVTVTVDGSTYENVGMRLKGNSSLFGLTTASAESPEDLPWLIRFDKFIDGQDHQGHNDIVIRSNSTETSMNEAVAAELLDAAGLASQQAVSTTLSFNGGDTELRLAMENPDDVWEAANFDSEESALYKADSTGDYSYRGDDADAYDDVFDQKVGDDDLVPLISFLDFINNADEATFGDELDEWLDTEAFATYLAFQDLIGNADDIDGRGNNSYLHYDYDTEQFTVVNWDLNLAFDTANVGGGGGARAGAADRGDRPDVGDRPAAPDVGDRPAGPGVGAAPEQGDNTLVSRFMANDTFAQMYVDATTDLTDSLFESGLAADVVATWVDTLVGQPSDIIDAATIEADAAAILAALPTT